MFEKELTCQEVGFIHGPECECVAAVVRITEHGNIPVGEVVEKLAEVIMPAWAEREGWTQEDWDDFQEECESERAHMSNDMADDWLEDSWMDEEHDALEAAVRDFLETGLEKGAGAEWLEVEKLAEVVGWGPHDAVAFYAPKI